MARYTTSTHDKSGYLTTKPELIQEMIDHYAAKIENAVDDITLVKEDFEEGADTLVLSYGIVSRSAAVAIGEARSRGRKVSSLVLQTLWPVPEKKIASAMAGVKKVRRPGNEHGAIPGRDRKAGAARGGGGGWSARWTPPWSLQARSWSEGASRERNPIRDLHGPIRSGRFRTAPAAVTSRWSRLWTEALVKLQPDPKDVVIVTDIGCIGLSDRYFATSAFHGLHGRSITYACGLKLARPELTVIALKGDGGCGIGGTHLLNVARRNIGITLDRRQQLPTTA